MMLDGSDRPTEMLKCRKQGEEDYWRKVKSIFFFCNFLFCLENAFTSKHQHKNIKSMFSINLFQFFKISPHPIVHTGTHIKKSAGVRDCLIEDRPFGHS